MRSSVACVRSTRRSLLPCLTASGPRQCSAAGRAARISRMRTLAISHQRDAGPGRLRRGDRARGHELDDWHMRRAAVEPPAGPVRLRRGDDLRRRDARRPGRRASAGSRPRSAAAPSCSTAGMPLLGRLPRIPAAGRGGAAAPRRAREPEIGWHAVELTAEGADDPLLGAARAARSRRSSGTATSARCRPGPRCSRAARCASGVRRRGRRPGGSSSTPRSRRPTPSAGSTTTGPTRTRCGSASTRSCSDRDRERAPRGTSSAGALPTFDLAGRGERARLTRAGA